MRKKRVRQEPEDWGGEGRQRYSDIVRETDPNTGKPFAGNSVLRECGPAGMALRLDSCLDFDEIVARQNLEQVGRILRRLELDRAEILELRTETRTILAELAA